MDNNLTLSTIQANLVWENPLENSTKFAKIVERLPQTDLLVLPELFTTGFTMNVESNAEEVDGPTSRWMVEMAKKYSIAICGSLIIREKANYYNRLYFAAPEGLLGQYDKPHLFRMGDEHRNYTKGQDRVVINYKGWRILPQFCYDLRFPVWSCNRSDYDLIINVANWPASRKHVWTTLLAARAIENQCFVLGVNRVGKDGTGLNHSGNTMLLDYKGQIIDVIPDNEEGYFTQTINLQDQNRFKENFPVYLDADNFILIT